MFVEGLCFICIQLHWTQSKLWRKKESSFAPNPLIREQSIYWNEPLLFGTTLLRDELGFCKYPAWFRFVEYRKLMFLHEENSGRVCGKESLKYIEIYKYCNDIARNWKSSHKCNIAHENTLIRHWRIVAERRQKMIETLRKRQNGNEKCLCSPGISALRPLISHVDESRNFLITTR